METKEATMAHIIGENIRNLRKARRMTQHQLAAKIEQIAILTAECNLILNARKEHHHER